MNERSEGDADGRGAGGGTLVVSPNWLGDAVMAMPAVRRWRGLHPATAGLAVSLYGRSAETGTTWTPSGRV